MIRIQELSGSNRTELASLKLRLWVSPSLRFSPRLGVSYSLRTIASPGL